MKFDSATTLEIVGIIGGMLCLFAFYRTAIGRWTGASLWYELDNLFSGVFLGYYSIQKHAYVNIILNLVWMAVAARGLSSWRERRRTKVRRRRTSNRARPARVS